MASTASRLFAEEAGEAAAELERGGFLGAPLSGVLLFIAERVSAWRGKWRDSFRPLVARIMSDAPVSTDRGTVRPDYDFTAPDLAEYFEDHLVRLSTQITDTTSRKLTEAIREAAEDGLSVDETAKRVRELGEEFGGARSRLIARTETFNALRGAAHIKAKRSGAVSKKTWATQKDGRVRDEHRLLEGMAVGIDEEFPGEGQTPGKPGCRCRLTYTVSDEASERRTA